MKKNNELKLLKAIVDSELLIKSPAKTNNLNFDVNNIYLLNRNIKQLYRLLRFVKQHDSNLFYFWLENKYLLNFYKHFLLNKDSNSTSLLFDTNLSILKNKKICSTALLVGNPNYAQNYIFDKLKLNKILLTTSVSSDKEKNCFGVYRLNSEFNNLKNICFYIVILKQAILGHKNNKKN